MEEQESSKAKEKLTIEYLYNAAGLLPNEGRVSNLLRSYYM